MVEKHPMGPDAVESFYARQRAGILAQLETGERRLLQLRPRTRRIAWAAGLAATAMLVLSVIAVLQLPPPRPTPGWSARLLDDVAAGEPALPLSAYGDWATATDPSAGGEDPRNGTELSTLSWLMAGDGLADSSLPGFLEPYGAWENEMVAEDTPSTS